jgi:hypothetical protein
MPARPRLIRRTLFCCIFLYVATETLLSPFYPQFFRKVFGIQEWEYTGRYIFFCRLTVLFCAPLWGLAARYVQVKHLLFVGQMSAGLATLWLANATTASEFLVLSILLVAVKSSYLLIYPLLVQLVGQEQSPDLAARYQGVFHAAIIVSTLLGVWIVAVAAPLRLFYLVAAAEFLQLLLCAYVLKGVQITPQAGLSASLSPTSGGTALIAAFGLVLVTFHLAHNVVRPYFTAFLMAPPSPALSLPASGAVFLIPSLMALVAMPFIRVLCSGRRLPLVYPGAMALAAVGLFLQTWADHITLLIASRMLYGLAFVIGQAALDVRLFMESRLQNMHAAYTWAASAQSLALLSAPLLATSLVDMWGLAAPLSAAAVLCLFNLTLAGAAIVRIPSSNGLSITPAFRKD